MAKVTTMTGGKAIAAGSMASTSVDPAVLERAAEETTRMGRADRVFHWDKRQGSDEAIVCGHDKTHGRLIINGGGTVLLCGATKQGAGCTYNVPVSV